MTMIPDAPYIREAERRGVDYVSEWTGLTSLEEEEDEQDE